MVERNGEARRRITLELSLERVAHIDALKKEWGIRNRGDVLERLLEHIFGNADGEEEGDEGGAGPAGGDAVSNAPGSIGEDLDEEVALVLIDRGSLQTLEAEFELGRDAFEEPSRARAGGGIDLPGFVRSRSDRLRSSFRPGPPAHRTAAPLPRLPAEAVQQALETAREHWLGLYGNSASETVLEAAMLWLARDVWPQSDQSEGRAFTWSAACQAMAELVSGWSDAPPSFERVIVTAGVLEDPFSGATLAVRIPTLIRRFVHRFRRRRKGTSFQTLEHTMTLQGALKLLQLPTDPGHRVTLAQIREAYRELALDHHPDSGGSVEAMRRLNEAYQLLKELYRTAR